MQNMINNILKFVIANSKQKYYEVKADTKLKHLNFRIVFNSYYILYPT